MKNKICKTLLAIGMLCISVAILPLRVYAEKYEYDEFDRVVKVEYDDGSYVTYNYDKNGNIVDTFVYDASKENIGGNDSSGSGQSGNGNTNANQSGVNYEGNSEQQNDESSNDNDNSEKGNINVEQETQTNIENETNSENIENNEYVDDEDFSQTDTDIEKEENTDSDESDKGNDSGNNDDNEDSDDKGFFEKVGDVFKAIGEGISNVVKSIGSFIKKAWNWLTGLF